MNSYAKRQDKDSFPCSVSVNILILLGEEDLVSECNITVNGTEKVYTHCSGGD